jgi:hypothetical protein
MEPDFPVWIGIFAIVLLIYLFMIYKRTSEVEKLKYAEAPLPENDTPDWMNPHS